MKKLALFLFVSLILSSCTERTHIKYGEGKTLEQLHKEAEEMRGISVVQIGDTEEEVSEKLKKHHSKFEYLFNKTYGYLTLKDNNRQTIYLSMLEIHESASDEYHNKNYADILKSVTVIISDEFSVDLRLMFFKDTLRSIEVLSNEEEIRDLFAEKYGEGIGYDERITKQGRGVMGKCHIAWGNEQLEAVYIDHFSSYSGAFEYEESFIIKSKSIPEQEIRTANDSLYKMRQMSEQDKKDKLIDAI